MIRVNNVVKTFGDFRALDGVNLHVRDGAIYGLVGPNGAGKSTIIRHITGIYKPDAGNIEIAGMPVYENPQAKARFAYIPDDLFYFQQADVMEMKRFYKGIYKTFDEDLFFRIRDAFSNIDPKMTIRRMSKGMQKQAAFWLAISCRPDMHFLRKYVQYLLSALQTFLISCLPRHFCLMRYAALQILLYLRYVCVHMAVLFS